MVSGGGARAMTVEQAMQSQVAQWGRRACRATGTEDPHHQRAAEAEYEGILERLEAQLASSRYALGDRPTAVDCVLLGGLRAHTLADPLCRRRFEKHTRVVAWAEHAADGWDGGGELAGFPDSTPLARHLLAIGRDHYRPFLLALADALAEGRKAFEIETYGKPLSYLAREYPQRSRELVRERIEQQLTGAERAAVEGWLSAIGLAECFAP
jgi:glutathione S-transferase